MRGILNELVKHVEIPENSAVLVDFWDTRCGACVAETPNLKRAYEKYRDKGFEIVGICLDDDEREFKNFVAEHDIRWPQIFEGKSGSGDLAKIFGVVGVPALFFFNRRGELTQPTLDAQIDSILEGQ
jgi:thiol-disulfide isomerase/thioredoxin